MIDHFLSRGEMRRKFFHVLGFAYALLYMARGRAWTLAILGAGLLGLGFLEARRLRDPRLNARFLDAFGGLHRDREVHRPSSLFWSLAGCWLAAALFPASDIARTAMLYPVVADTLGGLVGTSFGHWRVGDKSAEGTLAVFLGAWVVGTLSLAPAPGSPEVLVGALAVAVAEAWAPGPDDNLAVPVLAGGLLTLYRSVA